MFMKTSWLSFVHHDQSPFATDTCGSLTQSNIRADHAQLPSARLRSRADDGYWQALRRPGDYSEESNSAQTGSPGARSALIRMTAATIGSPRLAASKQPRSIAKCMSAGRSTEPGRSDSSTRSDPSTRELRPRASPSPTRVAIMISPNELSGSHPLLWAPTVRLRSRLVATLIARQRYSIGSLGGLPASCRIRGTRRSIAFTWAGPALQLPGRQTADGPATWVAGPSGGFEGQPGRGWLRVIRMKSSSSVRRVPR